MYKIPKKKIQPVYTQSVEDFKCEVKRSPCKGFNKIIFHI